MLYLYNQNGELSRLRTISNMPDWQLLTSGVTALVAGWFYTLGAGQIYFALRPSGKIISMFAFGSFAAVMIGYGVGHAAYFSVLTGAKDAFLTGVEAEVMTELPGKYFNLLVQILLLPGGIATILFSYAILFRKTHYPWWIVPFFPFFLYLLKDVFVQRLPGILKLIIDGGYANLIMLLFYLVSTIVLWNGGKITGVVEKYNTKTR